MEHYICPKCERPLSSSKAWHYCVSNDLDTIFKGKDPELELIFDKVLAEVIEWEYVSASAAKNCVVFIAKRTWLIARPMKSCLDLKFYTDERQEGYVIYSSKQQKTKWENHIRLSTLEQLEPNVFRHLKAAHDREVIALAQYKEREP